MAKNMLGKILKSDKIKVNSGNGISKKLKQIDFNIGNKIGIVSGGG